MRARRFIQIFIITILLATVLALASFFLLRAINESAAGPHRTELVSRMAESFDGKNPKSAMDDYNSEHRNRRGTPSLLWILDAKGNVLATNSDRSLPIQWSEIEHPKGIHEYVLDYSYFNLQPEISLLRLAGTDPNYLLVKLTRGSVGHQLGYSQLALSFIVIIISILLSLTLTFVYLQKKSIEAKDILSRLEKGDLKARFKIQSFDKIGNLMLDFNRMASEIEFLVQRVKKQESTRRELLQELSHDLRTPLTSISTSIETLQLHNNNISEGDRAALLAMVGNETHYLVQLLEDLFFIADLDEPSYRTETESLSLESILNSEIKFRQSLSFEKTTWTFMSTPSCSEFLFQGNKQLILRLCKNVLDNAARYTINKVHVQLDYTGKIWCLEVTDNGPGISDSEIANYGRRRQQRTLVTAQSFQVSLGLGSVIIKTIAELYAGTVEIQNTAQSNNQDQSKITGTHVRIFLKGL